MPKNYMPTVKKSRTTSTNNRGEGAARHCDVLPMGSLQERIIEWREGEGYTVHAYDMTPKMPIKDFHARLDLKENGNTTIASIEATYDTKMGVFGTIMNAFMVRPQMRKGMPTILIGLKHRAETGEYVTFPALKAASVAA